MYKDLDEKVLEDIYFAFAKKSHDKSGRFLEYRFADWIWRKDEIAKFDTIDFRRPHVRGENNIHEIDRVALDEDDNIVLITECKARQGPATKEQISKFLNMLKDVKRGREGDYLKGGYFVSFGGYSPEALDMIKGNVDDEGKPRPKSI